MAIETFTKAQMSALRADFQAAMEAEMLEETRNINNAKSYATEENLLKALAKMGLDPEKGIIVRNREGRWTIIYGLSAYMTKPAFHGFKVIN